MRKTKQKDWVSALCLEIRRHRLDPRRQWQSHFPALPLRTRKHLLGKCQYAPLPGLGLIPKMGTRPDTETPLTGSVNLGRLPTCSVPQFQHQRGGGGVPLGLFWASNEQACGVGLGQRNWRAWSGTSNWHFYGRFLGESRIDSVSLWWAGPCWGSSVVQQGFHVACHSNYLCIIRVLPTSGIGVVCGNPHP